MSHFFEEMPVNVLVGRRGVRGGRDGFAETSGVGEKDPLAKRETLELVRAYCKIDEGRVRKPIFEMVKAVGAASRAHKLTSGGKRKAPK